MNNTTDYKAAVMPTKLGDKDIDISWEKLDELAVVPDFKERYQEYARQCMELRDLFIKEPYYES